MGVKHRPGKYCSGVTRKRYCVALLIAVLIAAVAPVSADERWDGLYDRATLASASQLYSKNIRDTWTEDFIARLPANQQLSLAGTQLQLPPVGKNKHPFDYYAFPDRKIVVIPIQSVKFLDDLAIAHSWHLNRNCPPFAVLDYVGLLRFADLSKMPGRRLPDPYTALRIPKDALKNGWVNDVSGKILKSNVYFLMAHEAGHVLYGHRPYNDLTGAQAQAQEMQADAFALDVMERIGLTPQALPFFFMAAAAFEPVPSDFRTTAEYAAYRQSTATHPLTVERLSAIADRMQSRAAEFAKSEPQRQRAEQIIRTAGADIRQIATNMSDPKLREYQKFRGQRVDLEVLRNACP